MTKKSEKPMMSKEELNRLISMAEPYSATGNDTGLTPQKDDSEKKITPEPTVKSLPESAKVVSDVNEVGDASTASVVNAARAASVPTEHINPAIPNVSTVPIALAIQSRATSPAMHNSPSVDTSPTQPESLRRLSTKQRKASLDEYRETFMSVPKITDRQPVFLSRTTRDRLDEIVRRLGDRRMSVSGFLENLARQHLELYADDLEQWKRL